MYAIKNSTTLVLPEWFRILNKMAIASKTKGKEPLGIRVMPQNVATHWNDTYEMLNFAYIYCEAYNQVTSN
jgi:hypothetical protein